MAKGNVVAEVRVLCTAAKKPGHRLHGQTLTPAQWANEAGFPGSAASPLRRHMARQSNNGCGRNSRYGGQTATGMLTLLDLGDSYSKAPDKTKAATVAQRTRKQLAAGKGRSADKAKTVARKQERAAKVAEQQAS